MSSSHRKRNRSNASSLLAEYFNFPQSSCKAEVFENILAQYRNLVCGVLNENRQNLIFIHIKK
jgi:hypothetical protein